MCLGIPGQIIDIVDDENSIAKVDVSGVKRNVSVALVRPDGITAGDSGTQRGGIKQACLNRLSP